MLKNLKEFKLPEIEAEVLKFWKQNSIFEQSLKKNQGKTKFVFFEGPPTANGMPGIHHQIGRSFKDVIPRFKAMQGFDVPRKAGWDTHGLPVELQAEKELGFTGKQDIEKYGIAEFNKKCKELVWRYREQFEHATDRLGFWLDLKHPYVTYDNSYMESLWWIVGQMDKKKLLYQGHKVVPWCTRCGTALSSHELAQGYKEVEDTSVYVKFKVKKGQKIGKSFVADNKTYILSWTTTPWTLPGNVALAVGENIEYVVARDAMPEGRGEVYVVAKNRFPVIFPAGHEVLGFIYGRDLIGLEYEPLFDVKPLKSKKSYKVYSADFVTTTDGTGVVHTAVMYGEDDYKLGVELGLPQHHTVTEQGHFTKDVKGLAGMYAKSGKAEAAIVEKLTANGLLLKSEKYKHDYPFCWRCSTALLYYARTSWFVAMSKLREKLVKANNTVNWIPAHIKDGRFGEWLREVKDWNFSRERYWGTPLPVWRSKDGKSQMVVSSLGDIKKYGNINGNQFFGLRHGEATHNLEGKFACGSEKVLRSELTPRGIEQVKKAVKEIKKKKIKVIVASPFYRAQQSAKIIAKAVGAKVITDKRLSEVDAGVFTWQSFAAYWDFLKKSQKDWFTRAPEKGESHADVRRRVVECIKDVNKKFKNKNILFVSHGEPLGVLRAAMQGMRDEDYEGQEQEPKKATLFTIDAPVLPLDADGRLDLHRPYIDSVVLRDPKSKKELNRVKEVCDVWFDSGAMPFAQYGYPHQTKQVDFPADYIAEAIDQTRGWFYTLLAVATTLGKEAPYKNVICYGHIRDKNGQKMSKSKGNIVDPMMIMNKYGADVLRWYFFTINDPGDSKDFNEDDLAKITRRFVLILYNSFLFWSTYGQAGEVKLTKEPTNVLDRWVLARKDELVSQVTSLLDSYEIGKAALALEQFTDDLSRWYIRRSRDRFQSSARGDSSHEADYREASATLREVLLTLSRLLAPFMPFFSEALYRSIGGVENSVHLASWPQASVKNLDTGLLAKMKSVRDIAAAALALRAEAKIKVRQPLASLTIKEKSLAGEHELLDIICDEVNVKKVVVDAKAVGEAPLKLDTGITPELKEEGTLRELTRAISGLRADAGYHMADMIMLSIVSDQAFTDLMQRHLVELKKAVNAKQVQFIKDEKADVQSDTKLDGQSVWIGVRKM